MVLCSAGDTSVLGFPVLGRGRETLYLSKLAECRHRLQSVCITMQIVFCF